MHDLIRLNQRELWQQIYLLERHIYLVFSLTVFFPIMILLVVKFCHSPVRRPSSLLRYHYYGIAVKETSQYYDVMYSKKGAAWVNETGKKEVTKQTVAYSPRSKLGTLLPEFPNVKDLNLPASLPEERVNRSFKSPSLQPSPPPQPPPPTSPCHRTISAPPLAPAFYLPRDLHWVCI